MNIKITKNFRHFAKTAAFLKFLVNKQNIHIHSENRVKLSNKQAIIMLQ